MFFPNEINPTGDSTDAVYSTRALTKMTGRGCRAEGDMGGKYSPNLDLSLYFSSYLKSRFRTIMILSLSPPIPIQSNIHVARDKYGKQHLFRTSLLEFLQSDLIVLIRLNPHDNVP